MVQSRTMGARCSARNWRTVNNRAMTRRLTDTLPPPRPQAPGPTGAVDIIDERELSLLHYGRLYKRK